MKRNLITGMSGTGKSTVIGELVARGYEAVDADQDTYSHLVEVAPEEVTGVGGGKDWVWREDRIEALLAAEDGDVLFVSGCSPNQGRFRDRFDTVVLLSASARVIVERLANRTTNAFGKEPGELERTLQLLEEVEPALRRSADVEIDASAPLEEVVARILRLVQPEP